MNNYMTCSLQLQSPTSPNTYILNEKLHIQNSGNSLLLKLKVGEKE